ncbi:DUF6215 domain-containing protein [Streptomyces libani]|uniref:DUF6215 domain-containing protein n=1 Tax=Streptomyces nigrescens TaxID=1920 RepID=UPI0037F6F8E9
MTDVFDEPTKGAPTKGGPAEGGPAEGAGAWGQAVAAVALVAALGVGLWALQGTESSSGSDSAPPPATCSGGEAEKESLSLWRADGMVPDDAVLLRVAEKVLPTVPGWAAGG